MNKNVFIVLVGGFVVSVLVALLVQMSLGGKEKEVSVALQSVLVAAQNIPVGHELEADDLKWKKWPEDVIFSGAIVRDEGQSTIDAISGKSIRAIGVGEPIHKSAVVKLDDGFLSAKISSGMRAVGIEVRKHIVSDRLIMPGDAVDVIVSYRVRVDSRNNVEAQSLVSRYASETILENVRILAVDENTSTVRVGSDGDKKKKKKKAKKKATVTLEVTPEGAEQLALAMEMGDISFATRGIAKEPETQDDNMTTDVHMSRVLTDLSKLTTGSGGAVRVYRGSSMEEVRGRLLQPEESGVDFSVQERPADVVAPVYKLPLAPSTEGGEE